MTPNSSDISEEGIFHPVLTDEFANFSETTDSLQKILDSIKDVIQFRTDIFIQRKEKHQQYLNDQLVKLRNKEDQYRRKCENLEVKMEESKYQLMQIEYSYFDARNKLAFEKERNKSLQDKINQLKLDNKQQEEKFCETSALYTTIINLYKDYLNMQIDLEVNSRIATVTFLGYKKNFEVNPFVKFKIIDDNKFKVIKMYPPMEEDKENVQPAIQGHEIILFFYNFRRHFLNPKSTST